MGDCGDGCLIRCVRLWWLLVTLVVFVVCGRLAVTPGLWIGIYAFGGGCLGVMLA